MDSLLFLRTPCRGQLPCQSRLLARCTPYGHGTNRRCVPIIIVHPLSQICRFRSAAKSASSPFRGALGKTGIRFHSSDRTPSVSPFGLTAPPEVEPRALRAVHT